MHPVSRHNGRRSAALAITMFAWLAGCSPTPHDNAQTTSPAKVGYQMPAGIHYVDHWVSTPAVDLMSPDGTFIRAFAEADDVRIFNIDGKKGSYPGFVGADRTNQRAGGGGGEWFGYAIRWINEFQVLPDGSATAQVCSLHSITPDGSVHEGLLNETLKYQRVGASPPADQHGPARALAVSVFGDWQATDYSAPVPITKESLEPCERTTPAIDKSTVGTAPGWPVAAGSTSHG
jgi:hypothetical protein